MKIKVCTCVYQERANTVLLRLLSLGKIEGKRKRRGQRMRCLNSITDSMDMNLGKLWEMVRDRETWGATVYRVTKSQTCAGNWITTTNTTVIKRLLLPKTHMVFLKQLLSAQHAFRCYAKIVLKLISFYPSNILRKWVLFSPFYRKENEGLWGGDGKRESWDGGLERETAGLCTATI